MNGLGVKLIMFSVKFGEVKEMIEKGDDRVCLILGED